MPFNRLENSKNKEVIREEITILTDLLNQATQSMVKASTFDKINLFLVVFNNIFIFKDI